MTDPRPVVLNTRFLTQEVTGVQRYAREMLARLGDHVDPVGPKWTPSPIAGHVWEQTTLPGLCKNRLLWSPANTGPLKVRNQVVTIHDASTLDHPEWFSRRFALWYRYLLPRLARQVKKVITVSEFSRQRLVETCRISPDKIAVVPNGVDTNRFQPVPQDQAKIFRRRNRLNRPYFLYFGSLEPRKNIGALIEGWEELGWREGELVIVGTPGHVFRERGYRGLPHGVRLWGRGSDEDLPNLLSGAVAFVYPSLYEGFGLPILEAMACGCPVLAANTTSLPEVCGESYDQAPKTGAVFYFDPKSPSELAQGMHRWRRIDSGTRTELIRRGRSRAAEFSWDRTAERTWSVLEDVLKGA